MKQTVAILTIGSEILDGRVQDSNANYLCKELHKAGFSVGQILSCDDDIKEIVQAINFVITSNDVIIFSGGLGPTTDDLTREAIADFLNEKLILNQEALNKIKDIFTKRSRVFEASNEKQALFPANSKIINNYSGMAPGFSAKTKLDGKEKLLLSLPGVPSEMKLMFEKEALQIISNFLPNAVKINQSAFKIFGLPESVVGASIKALNLPEDIVVSYRAHYPEIHVILKSASNQLLQTNFEKVCAAIGKEFIFSLAIDESLEMVVHKLLIAKGLTISTAESCTAGIAASMLTNCPGSSQYFIGSAVTYANAAKTAILDIPNDLIEKHGAVSSQVALAMAENCRQKFSTDLAISITGIAGPDGGTELKPVGLFYIGLASRDKVTAHKYLHVSSRRRIREYAAYMALDLVRRHLSRF